MSRNAVVAYDDFRARQFIEAFQLDKAQWFSFGIAAAVTGRRYDRVIIIRPHWQMSKEDAANFESLISRWITQVSLGGYMRVM